MSDLVVKTTPMRKHWKLKWTNVARNGSSYGGTNAGSTAWTDTFIGHKNPYWKEQIKAGVQAATVLTATRVKAIARNCFIQYRCSRADGLPLGPTQTEFVQLQGNLVAPMPTSPAGLSNVLADNRAKQQLVRKIRKSQTTMMSGVTTGEIGQTVRMITDRAVKIRKGLFSYGNELKSIRRRTRAWDKLPNATRAKKRLEVASSTWLEYQLGWAPLVADIKQGAQALAEHSVGEIRPRYVIIRAIGVDETVQSEQTISYPWSIIGAYFNCRLVLKHTVKVRYIACVDAGISGSLDNQRMGLAPDNWLPTLWELIPYSFVVDYFTNVGSIIDSASLCRSSVRWMVKTTRRQKVYEHALSAPRWPTTLGTLLVHPIVAIPGKSSTERTSVNREPYVGSLVPSLEVYFPNNAKQIANLVGLAVMRNKLKNYFS